MNILFIRSHLLIFRYPVIISIENHCSPAQRNIMANMFIEIFGGEYSKKINTICTYIIMLSRKSYSGTFIIK
jgi:hypothetical protein